MIIDQAFQRSGLGTRLLKHCERVLFRTYPALRLESFESNEQANSFYRNNGWSKAGTYFDEGSGSRKIILIKQRSAAQQRHRGLSQTFPQGAIDRVRPRYSCFVNPLQPKRRASRSF